MIHQFSLIKGAHDRSIRDANLIATGLQWTNFIEDRRSRLNGLLTELLIRDELCHAEELARAESWTCTETARIALSLVREGAKAPEAREIEAFDGVTQAQPSLPRENAQFRMNEGM